MDFTNFCDKQKYEICFSFFRMVPKQIPHVIKRGLPAGSTVTLVHALDKK